MSANKAKGTAAETAIVNYLRQWFPDARRNPPAGAKDVGDIGGVPAVIEVKNVRTTALGEWLIEAQIEGVNYLDRYGKDLPVAVWHKRRGRGKPADWYVTMDGATFARLLREASGIDDCKQ